MMTHTPFCPLAFGMPGTTEWIIILIIGLLIFGKRLPEVGKSIGKGIVEFKKGLSGVDDELKSVRDEINKPASQIESSPPNTMDTTAAESRSNAGPSTQS